MKQNPVEVAEHFRSGRFARFDRRATILEYLRGSATIVGRNREAEMIFSGPSAADAFAVIVYSRTAVQGAKGRKK